MNEIQIKVVSYGGWDNCVEIINDIVDLIVTVNDVLMPRNEDEIEETLRGRLHV